MIFFSLRYSLFYEPYLRHGLFLNESGFITINYFLLYWLWLTYQLFVVRHGRSLLESMNVYCNIKTDTTTGWILKQFSWMLQRIKRCCNKWTLLWYFSILSVIFVIYYYYFCRRKVVKNIAGDISFRHKHDKYFSNFAENWKDRHFPITTFEILEKVQRFV